MAHRPVHSLVSFAFVLAFVLLLTGTQIISAHYTGGGATLAYEPIAPSIGGPSSEAQLHAAAPVLSESADGQIERIMLGILLVLVGYALHAMLAEYTQEQALPSPKRRAKARL